MTPRENFCSFFIPGCYTTTGPHGIIPISDLTLAPRCLIYPSSILIGLSLGRSLTRTYKRRVDSANKEWGASLVIDRKNALGGGPLNSLISLSLSVSLISFPLDIRELLASFLSPRDLHSSPGDPDVEFFVTMLSLFSFYPGSLRHSSWNIQFWSNLNIYSWNFDVSDLCCWSYLKSLFRIFSKSNDIYQNIVIRD